MEDKRELFKQPLHSIYIPCGLIIAGTLLFGLEYLPYSLTFIVGVCSFKYYEAYQRRSLIHKTQWRDLELIDKTLINRNTLIFRFKLNREDEVLDIPTGHHVACCFTINGKDEIRFYSPILNQFDAGFFDILVKHYENGVVSRKLAELREGQTVKFRGPFGTLDYVPNMAKKLALVAGGSGITPILQVITDIITNPEDNTSISLIFANESEKDILLKSEIDEIAKKYPDFEVNYTVTNAPENWTGSTGYVTKEMMQKYLPEASPENRMFICGPPGLKSLAVGLSEELGWEKDNVFCF
ncbi:NADH-cytochrome b-5 reductase [Suhomyces tanzawaensis NRRL Y-17324]|uniref:NADH-cytochrome b5 reductase n=1 Tax=Suhomyces tanzawaensis NRRL Y-17324 TaxID=984487 RepID=A0A1E4SNQ7_9ASCO|nr:NADH-cytochrome b-5 reductase [Suhomyces tanzawaensis NRRL Y-17324]ODV81128.1 NADH-cytochrome b-5 reductase [Suhomyces tanzawaensis NRRL Y-17324]